MLCVKLLFEQRAMLLLDERRVVQRVDIVELRRGMLSLPKDGMPIDVVQQSIKLVRHVRVAAVVEEDVRPLPTFSRFRSGTYGLAVVAGYSRRREGTQRAAI